MSEPKKAGVLTISQLPVTGGHSLYVERSGNLDGIPVVYLHGGPGAGCTASSRDLFDPSLYHIIQYDQRGCGQSSPHASVTNNTTWDLVQDLEQIRIHLGIDKWLVCGGSWGCTLALLYAERYPERVTGLILRGLFLGTQSEVNWLYQHGASELFPEHWHDFVQFVPEGMRDDLIGTYHKYLMSEDRETAVRAAHAWCKWEVSILMLQMDASFFDNLSDDFCLAMARIGCHFFINDFFFDDEDEIVNGLDAIREIPTALIQGRYDVVTPVRTAWRLKQLWPQLELNIVPDAGHASSEPGISAAITQAAAYFAKQGHFEGAFNSPS